jgi:hypothetical protein
VFFHSKLSYSYLNAEGLPTKDGRRVASEIHSTRAQLLADIGEHWALEYSPTWMNYTARALSDSFDQSAQLSAAASFTNFGVNFKESYESSKPTLIETGRQTKRETWATELDASYKLSPRVRLLGSAKMDERYTDIAPTVRTWSGQTAVNVTASPRLNFGLGPGFRYSEIVDAPDVYGESYTAHLNWRPTAKLSLSAEGGLEKTHSTASAGLDITKPHLELSLGYHPFETTSISLDVSKKVSASYFKNQVTEGLTWDAGIQQRLLGHYYLSASYGQKENEYISTNTLVVNNRSDTAKILRARLSTKIVKRFSVAATFQKTSNTSSLSGFTFSSKQYGGEISCKF